MKTKPPRAIRISATIEVEKALLNAKKIYPTLSDAEIFKLGLSKIDTGTNQAERDRKEREGIMRMAAYSVGYDYLSDPEEDAYVEELVKFHNGKN